MRFIVDLLAPTFWQTPLRIPSSQHARSMWLLNNAIEFLRSMLDPKSYIDGDNKYFLNARTLNRDLGVGLPYYRWTRP